MESLYKEDYIEIITRLRKARIDCGLTQEQLSSVLGISQSIISKVESCERRLDILEFLIWTKTLNVSVKSIIPVKYFFEMEK